MWKKIISVFSSSDKQKGFSSSKTQQPKFLKKEKTGNSTYEVYQGVDPESAKEFLMTKRVDEERYYIIVETPLGNWGVDVKGLFLEHLEPWQKNLAYAECEGSICKMPDEFSLRNAAKGFNDNFLATVECGQCKHQWIDGVAYQNSTIVRCPNCKKYNKVDSRNHQVIFYNNS